MTTLAELRKNRNTNLENLTKKLTATTYTKAEKEVDLDEFILVKDATGAGSAVLRFLPGFDGEEPFYIVHKYSFKDKNTGKYYIENSLSTLGQKDPCAERNSKLWADGIKTQQDEGRGRKTEYWANVYVVKHPGNSEDEGRVMKYKFGKQIYGFIKDQLQPSDEDEVMVNIFDIEEGANFRLKCVPKIAKIGDKTINFPNYEKSKFEAPSPLFTDDKKLQAVLDAQHSLIHLVDEKNFKTYDELKKRLDLVTGAGTDIASLVRDDDTPAEQMVERVSNKTSKPKAEARTEPEDDENQWFKDLEELDAE